MSHPDSDLLRKAVAAMRVERTGHNAGSGFTRARVLNDVRAQRKKRSRWWRMGFPVGIILAGTTAWASASGKWPEVWVNVSTLLNLPLTDNGASERSLATAKTTNSARSRHSAPVLDNSQAPSDELEAEPAAAQVPTASEAALALPGEAALAPSSVTPIAEPHPGEKGRAAVHSPRTARGRRTSDAATRPSVDPVAVLGSASEQPASPPELEAEIRAFRRADDLYRRSGELQSAVGAYRQYVRDYPSGRFVPEAKYNTALSLLKLGRPSEARALLEPFARGTYGAYRQEAAQKLLDALR